jgi:hypothetical protein
VCVARERLVCHTRYSYLLRDITVRTFLVLVAGRGLACASVPFIGLGIVRGWWGRLTGWFLGTCQYSYA